VAALADRPAADRSAQIIVVGDGGGERLHWDTGREYRRAEYRGDRKDDQPGQSTPRLAEKHANPRMLSGE
jgi:hypothetical protein